MAKYHVIVNGKQYVVEVGDVTTSPIQVVVNGEPKTVTIEEVTIASAPPPSPAPPAPPPAAPAPQTKEPVPEPPSAPAPAGAVEGEVVVAPMPGKVLSVRVQVGDRVSEGDTVCTLEAMKMEMPISSTTTGTVKAVHVQPGVNVSHDDPLVTIG
ncbi:MAG: acetyl-CoA carboxylase biotin carboxyl carrier protein subunit [Chloroflexi bacterium]|nr:acetyl-CoA carboxylase biotin carboxyl carrier protein subunit [Chloroflexota bacterium]